jgi:broad specificity phosphatase PhoE/HSP20 family molecular chaperone IbpA
MNPGVVDGLSVEEIRGRFPDEWEKKINEPYSHRFPRAESYHDLSVRLEPIIFELERAGDDVLIIGQSSVLRCLIAYLQGLKPNEIPSIPVHEGDLIEISPQAYGVKTRTFNFWDPIAKRKERDEAYFRGRQLTGLGNGSGDETLPDFSKLPLHALDHTPPPHSASTLATITPTKRSSSQSSDSSSTEGGGQADRMASDAGGFTELGVEDYDKLSKMEREIYDKARADNEANQQAALPYQWTQTLESLSITLQLPPGTRGKDLDVDIKQRSLRVSLKRDKQTIVEDELFNRIKEEDSTWSLSEGNLDIHLEKAQRDQWWPHVLIKDPKIDTTKIVPENSKLSDLDGETRAMVEKMMFDNQQKQMGKPTSDQLKQQQALENFKKQHPEMDFSNVKMG